MILVNETLYHFRDGRRKNANWMVGNEFIVDDSYQCHTCGDVIPIDPDIPLIEKKIEYYSMSNDVNLSFDKAEKMLELCRTENHPELISRLNCMYFCDKNSLEFWSHKFPSYYELFEVVLNGEAFKSSSLFFPFAAANCTYEDFIRLCEKYWTPDLESEEVNEYNEYLFRGSVFVRERLDINKVRNRYN